MKIPISFKESEKEIYDFIKAKLSPSVYIKELVIADMKKSNINKEERQERKKRNFELDM
ncbi:MAG: hypothetical protein LLF98_06395 [Clostridium sp.]|uniref:hypothetical protein n=1 Tax=Clostridium sp. TaxID=1506 RepID=UPI0025BC16F4|nr:hypothetical protein [Clostridium sp.]MCE5220895.1 hypothetical protein [Clostridium sp.]